MRLRGVADLEARQQAELHRLPGQRIGSGDHRLARDDRRRRRQHDQRQQQDFRNHPIEGIFDRGGIGKHQRALTEIVDQQRRQHEIKPSGLDRLASEVTEIGIERLAAGHGEKYRAQRHQSDRPVRKQEMNGVPGIDRGQHRRVVADMNEAHHRKRGEPDNHDRPEGRCDARRAAALDREQHDQDENRQRHHIVLERRRCELETFDRGQHRNRRRDHGIADEHRGADDAQRQQRPASAAQRTLTQRHQRKRAALAVIVGAQQQQHVFRGDDDEAAPTGSATEPRAR